MTQYDALIVGAGLYGATLARELTDAGKRVLVIDKREYVGGNCYDELIDGQIVNRFGGHIFHTSDVRIWRYVQRFADWRQTAHTVYARVNQHMYSFPLNLMTLHQLWGVTTAEEARAELDRRRSPAFDPSKSMEHWCLHHIGAELYETFIYGYTTKQWGKTPNQLPSSIFRRLPIRLDEWNNRYFSDTYEGVPIDGYTAMISTMLDDADVRLGEDYLRRRDYWDALAPVTVYSGPIDALYGYQYGALEYRSLRFDYTGSGESIGAATINYPALNVPYTRRVDFARIRRETHERHVVLTEYPTGEGEPMYPVRDAANAARYGQYAKLAASESRLIVGGRLGAYQYLDMHQAIGMALKDARTLL